MTSYSNADPGNSDVPIDRLRRPIERLIHLENISGVALVGAAIAAIVLANSAAGESVAAFWETHLEIRVGAIVLDESLTHWVNDALMSVFFLVAGLEIKRELVSGDLRRPRQAALPVVAALGGMIVPALLYVTFSGAEGRVGWGIPMATDIAFAVGVLTLLGKRVPSKLKLFLLTLAIVDDLGAILVIALFYSSSLNLTAMAVAGLGLAMIVVLRLLGVWWTPIYVGVGVGVWLATFESGVHATLAGVACGLLAPAVAHRPNITRAVAHPDSAINELKAILFDVRESRSVADRLIHILHPWTALFVLPVFAFANAGVSLSGSDLANAVTSPVSQAVVVGLVIGKPLGIVAAAWLAVKAGLAYLPDGIYWRHVAGVASLAGIGFTVSLFITDLAFASDAVAAQSKIGVLAATVLAASIGSAILVHKPKLAPIKEELLPITYQEFDETQPESVLANNSLWFQSDGSPLASSERSAESSK